MAVNLNLLPPELSVSKNLNKILKFTRSLGVISTAVFLVFIIVVVAVYVVYSLNLRSLNTANLQLQDQVKAQESTEQSLVLLKDRATKIRTVLNLPSSLGNLSQANLVLASSSASVDLAEMDVDPVKVTLNMNFKTNSDLSQFLQYVSSSNAFKTIVMTSFGLNPLSGYTLSLDLTKK